MAKLTTLLPRVPRLDTRTAPHIPKYVEPFYQSREWRSLVERLKTVRGPYCGRCGAKRRLIGNHIKALKDRPELALDEANVELICWPCHTPISNAERAARLAKPASDVPGG